MNTTTHRRRSKVWLAFSPEGKNDENAICKICNETVPRILEEGEKCTTSKLWKHLNQEHLEVVKMLADVKKEDIIREGLIDKWNLHALHKQTKKGFTSKVWKYYTLNDFDKNIAICCECDSRISRGTDRNTTSMWNHVKLKHPDLYAQSKEDAQEEEQDTEGSSHEKAVVQNQFLLFNARHNSYICKTCGMIMKLDSPDEQINTSRLFKHLDNIFHKRVQHGLEQPKRPLTMYRPNAPKASEKSKPNIIQVPQEIDVALRRKYPAPPSPDMVIENREVDLVHSAVILHAMYLQQKRDLGCDCTIVIPSKSKRKSTKSKRTAVRGDDNTIKYYETDSGIEFKVHSCVFAVISEKMRTLLDNSDVKTITMQDVKKEAMLGFVEVVYLGKLKNICRMDDWDIWDIYCVANTFNCAAVMRYLKRECPHVIEKFLPSLKSSKVGTPSVTQVLSDNGIGNNTKLNDEYKNFINSAEPAPSGLALLEASEQSVLKAPSRRKRQPLSSQFRLQVLEKRKKAAEGDGTDSEGDIGNGPGEESPLNNGPRFEIQGDTAILRASPEDDFTENGESFHFVPPVNGPGT